MSFRKFLKELLEGMIDLFEGRYSSNDINSSSSFEGFSSDTPSAIFHTIPADIEYMDQKVMSPETVNVRRSLTLDNKVLEDLELKLKKYDKSYNNFEIIELRKKGIYPEEANKKVDEFSRGGIFEDGKYRYKQKYDNNDTIILSAFKVKPSFANSKDVKKYNANEIGIMYGLNINPNEINNKILEYVFLIKKELDSDFSKYSYLGMGIDGIVIEKDRAKNNEILNMSALKKIQINLLETRIRFKENITTEKIKEIKEKIKKLEKEYEKARIEERSVIKISDNASNEYEILKKINDYHNGKQKNIIKLIGNNEIKSNMRSTIFKEKNKFFSDWIDNLKPNIKYKYNLHKLKTSKEYENSILDLEELIYMSKKIEKESNTKITNEKSKSYNINKNKFNYILKKHIYSFEIEYVEGSPLINYVIGKKLDSEKIYNALMGTLHGLKEMREAGVKSHRDLHPENIILEKEKGLVTILDFSHADYKENSISYYNTRYGSGTEEANDLHSISQIGYALCFQEPLFADKKIARDFSDIKEEIKKNRKEAYQNGLEKYLNKIDKIEHEKLRGLIKDCTISEQKDIEKIYEKWI